MKEQPRVLLIDDNPDFCENYGFLLEDQGYRVVTALSGREGLAYFGRERFDLVITDILMPDVEGIETIRELRKQDKDIPIIAVSGGGRNAADSYLQAAALMGAQRTLHKPFSFTTLNRTVEELLCADRTGLFISL